MKKENTKAVDFKTAFEYPFHRWVGLLNILWALLPIVGWLVLYGYVVRIVKTFIKGQYDKLPKLSFVRDLKLGFWMFVKTIPFGCTFFVVFAVLTFIPIIGIILQILIGALILPMLMINFFKKESVDSSFDITKTKAVFVNITDYIMALLKTIGLAIVFVLMMIVLVGIPAHMFTKNIFLADFYRRRVD